MSSLHGRMSSESTRDKDYGRKPLKLRAEISLFPIRLCGQVFFSQQRRVEAAQLAGLASSPFPPTEALSLLPTRLTCMAPYVHAWLTCSLIPGHCQHDKMSSFMTII
jgi:hypothetical protein